jgi:LPXTG-motif cell wall-anchored protein
VLRRIVFSLMFGFAALALLASPAAAQYPDQPVQVAPDEVENVTPPAVEGDGTTVTDVDADTEVAGDVTTRQLPVTGGDLVGLTAIGLGAIAVGGVLVARRRTTS